MNRILEKIRAKAEEVGRRAARFLGPVAPVGVPAPVRVPSSARPVRPRRSR